MGLKWSILVSSGKHKANRLPFATGSSLAAASSCALRKLCGHQLLCCKTLMETRRGWSSLGEVSAVFASPQFSS